MSLGDILAAMRADFNQCDLLVQNAHYLDANNQFLFPEVDRRQITVAAFLNMFIAWETFLEASFAAYMTGEPTTSGRLPVRYTSPPSIAAAKQMIIGVQRYFDYGNHENVKKIARMYFENGDPFEPHLSSITVDLTQLRSMRNASAHITSTTQTVLETLAQTIFGTPQPGVKLYNMLIMNDPREAQPITLFASLRDKLLVSALLISQ